MLVVPLQSLPSQQQTITLGGQYCTIKVYTLNSGLFLDLTADGKTIITGAPCLNHARLVREAYLGFTGDLIFTDTQGVSDPTYDGLDSRYQLIYIEASHL